MFIRPAKIEDKEDIAALMMLAMDDFVYAFIGETSRPKALEFLKHFIEYPDNIYSYQNCWVVDEDNHVVAMANVYEGNKQNQLKKPVQEFLLTQYSSSFTMIDETEEGEFYIDAIAVDSDKQGKGYGQRLLQFLINHFVLERQETLGLLVDKENPKAKRLYNKLGFEYIKDKTFGAKTMEHLQLSPKNKYATIT